MWKNQIIQATDKVFEVAWQTEKRRILEVLDRYNQNKDSDNHNVLVYAVTGDLSRNYNNIDRKTYKEVNSMKGIIRKVAVDGKEKALQSICEDYKEAMVAKLKKSLDKHTFDCEALSIDVKNSPQGYCITSKLSNGNTFETNCIGVGGYNIVSFHYRYTHKIKTQKS